VLGTVAYMSPEQAEGKPVDTDIFAFSCLYEMLMGGGRFRSSRQATLAAVMRDERRPYRTFARGKTVGAVCARSNAKGAAHSGRKK
jgi:serine/threonine protein kinase